MLLIEFGVNFVNEAVLLVLIFFSFSLNGLAYKEWLDWHLGWGYSQKNIRNSLIHLGEIVSFKLAHSWANYYFFYLKFFVRNLVFLMTLIWIFFVCSLKPFIYLWLAVLLYDKINKRSKIVICDADLKKLRFR
jgi:hypothetical protein